MTCVELSQTNSWKRKPKTFSLCFPQFPFNLTHASVLSLKAPFPLMASLSFFTEWQLEEAAFSIWMQLPKVQYWKYIFSSQSNFGKKCIKEVMKPSQFSLGGGRHCVKPSSQRHKQSPWKENFNSLSTENFWKHFNSPWVALGFQV